MWTEWKQGRFIEIGRFWNLWTKNACIETYTFRIISFFSFKKKNRLSKGLLQWNRRKKEHQMHRMKSVDNLKTAVMAFVKEHFSQIESNDGFVCTVIGKHEDSKCVWNALLLFVLDPRKIYLFFFRCTLFGPSWLFAHFSLEIYMAFIWIFKRRKWTPTRVLARNKFQHEWSVDETTNLNWFRSTA